MSIDQVAIGRAVMSAIVSVRFSSMFGLSVFVMEDQMMVQALLLFELIPADWMPFEVLSLKVGLVELVVAR